VIEVHTEGSFDRTEQFLSTMESDAIYSDLDNFGQQGIDLLRAATPKRTGRTAGSWTYTIDKKMGKYRITWHNTDTEGGPPVAILIQYGHATGTGGYVQAIDFVNPVMAPLFAAINEQVWEKVRNA